MVSYYPMGTSTGTVPALGAWPKALVDRNSKMLSRVSTIGVLQLISVDCIYGKFIICTAHRLQCKTYTFSKA